MFGGGYNHGRGCYKVGAGGRYEKNLAFIVSEKIDWTL
jgi:hypothetical protein